MSIDALNATASILARADSKAVPKDGEPNRRKRRLSRGYKLIDEARRQLTNTLMTDAQVLECRARYEFETGWLPKRLAQEYGTSAAYMYQLLSYQTRSKLIPKRPAP